MVEAWKGLDIAREEGRKIIIVFGDSMLVIRAMVGNIRAQEQYIEHSHRKDWQNACKFQQGHLLSC
jgi:ribonuclease HI